MARWFNKRWAWAAVIGATVTVGFAAGRGDPPQKVGSTVSLNIDGKGERQFKVLKCEKQPDGTYLSELKDAKSGETITLLDKPDDVAPKGAEPPKKTDPPKNAPSTPPKAKPRTNDPLLPPVTTALADDMNKEKEKRPILGRIFGDKDKEKVPPTTTVNSPPKAEMPSDPAKKPGPWSRVFGPKKPSTPSMPAATVGPVAKPTPSAPPAVLPVPPGGLTGSSTPPPTFPGGTSEPPRVTAPITPKPAPITPAPIPAFPTPIPQPLPTPIPSPAPVIPVPALPAPLPSVPPPAGGGLPPIPVPPGGTSSSKPIQVVVPVGYVPAGIAFDRDVEPFVIALQSMRAPSARLAAAKGLAEGRHRSAEGVKDVLFQAAQMDPCGEVRAACITHLCDLGYFSPHFLGHIQTACSDPDPMVSAAAKAACAKMIRK